MEGEGGRKYLYKKCSAHLGFTRLGGGGGRGWKLACPDGLEQALPLAKKVPHSAHLTKEGVVKSYLGSFYKETYL